uniref:Uncharacterized protein n=1 Tax=Peronospora matthiolae TaxID=2874970 RepID=A0AAV1TA70_9STRA
MNDQHDEQKLLYQELPFRAPPGMRRRSFQRARVPATPDSQLLGKSVATGQKIKPLLEEEPDERLEPGYTYPLLHLDMYMLILGRFLVGIASGAATILVPLISVSLHLQIFGVLWHDLPSCNGAWYSREDLLAFGFAGESDSLTRPGWRLMFGFTGLLGLLQLDAEETLRNLRQLDNVGEEMDSISAASTSESGNVQSIGDVLRDPEHPLAFSSSLSSCNLDSS